jgi:hydrogenase maturation protein HypF
MAGEVEIALEGTVEQLAAFRLGLEREVPPLAHIDDIAMEACPAEGRAEFTILPSADQPDRRQPVSPDVALCALCEAELFDTGNRRYRYPFITCTDCGPRFTVIEAMPYDRERTSMRAFAQCPECLAEYRTPGDRRYHSQSNSCPACGPRLWFERAGAPIQGDEDAEPLLAAADVVRAGAVLAVRGLGGFHLAADATNEQAVHRLRARKRREAKPLAVMVRSLEQVREVAHVSSNEAALLTSRARPIVLLRARRDSPIAPSVSPRLDTIGVMLAYTPLHHLLLALCRRPLVMTSGNVSDEPIATDNADAQRRLGDIADAFLLHDRDIVARYDDSVLRIAAGGAVFLRRARGYAPLSVTLPVESPVPIVAVGPHLKNTFTIAAGRHAYVSQHIGDLENLETLEHFRESLATFRGLFRVEPEVAVRDLHPGYLSTRVAEELGCSRVISVQHHHAHVAAVMAEHGVVAPAVGVAFDGTGYGDDGNVWGAEILIADLTGYQRVGHLDYARLPGGDIAARRPWRTALGYLELEPVAEAAFRLAFAGVDPRELRLAGRQLARGVNAPLASSMGRLFDAAAAVLGVRRVSHYEGQAAMELEALAGTRNAPTLPFPVLGAAGDWVLDPIPLLAALGERRAAGVSVRALASEFHESVAAATAELVGRAADLASTRTVALSGGCFQNARLLTSICVRLEWQGLDVLVPSALSPNDGAVSYGQAAVAAALLQHERGR